MSELTYTFEVGTITCTVLSDGTNQPTLDVLFDRFPSVPEDAMEAAVATRYPDGRIMDGSMNCLLIQTDGHTILVDTGNGPGRGGLHERLSAMINFADIDIVFITHAHGDHVGGLINADGSRAFPNARHIMARQEWDHWMTPQGVAAKADWEPFLNPRLGLLKDVFELIEGETELAPGVQTLAAYGHTPGHTGLVISSEGQQVYDLVDSIHYGVQLDHPDWSPRFDTDPVQAAETRRRLLNQVADEDVSVLIYHYAFPGLGHIVRDGDHFDWKPR